MKQILTVFFTVIIVAALCTNAYAAGSVEKGEEIMDSKVAETIKSQLSRDEKEPLINIDNTLSNEPILTIYTNLLWSLSENPTEDMIAEGKKYNETLKYKEYYVLSDPLYRVRYGQGKFLKEEISDAPQYIKDILALPNQVDINGKQSVVTGVYCFDEYSWHAGAFVYILTQTETLIKYYEYPDSEAILFSESDFRTYAIDYYAYRTSYEHNYSESGEPIGGGTLTFKDFIGTYNKKAEPAEHAGFKWLLVGGSAFLGVLVLSAGIIIYRQKRRKTAC